MGHGDRGTIRGKEEGIQNDASGMVGLHVVRGPGRRERIRRDAQVKAR